MSQLLALVWLKWRLFRNSMRSRKAAVGRAASVAGTLAALAFSMLIAASLGVAAYALASLGAQPDAAPSSEAGQTVFLFLLSVFAMLYLMWAVVPLGLGGGGRFDAGLLLLYPVSLKKLFAVDLLSELSSLSSVFAVPLVLAVAAGAGAAVGNLTGALAVAVCAVAFGLVFAKLLSTAVGSLMRRRRTRGETVLALIGAVVGLGGAFLGQLAPVAARYAEHLHGLWWTPPGAAALALSEGLREGGGWALLTGLAVLAAYTLAFVLVTYRIARRTALGVGGASRASAARAGSAKEGNGERHGGWRLPLLSAELSAVVEKELRYAVRNAQLRVIALMAVGLTIVLRLSPLGGARGARGSAWWDEVGPYAEGAGAVFSVLYIFTLVSPLTTNLFGYDGAGMRALVLAPVERRTILVGKNIAVTSVATVLAAAGVGAGGVVFGDLTPRVLGFVALSFVTFAALVAAGGNWLSINFPKRVEFGKRMSRSGVAGLLLLPFFLALLVPPAAAILVSWAARSLAVKYVILAAFAALSVTLYLLLVRRQGRALERRELEILEAVTGRDGETDGQV